jgi:hypothetical protein
MNGLSQNPQRKHLGSAEKGRETVLERAKDRFWVSLATKIRSKTLEAEAWMNGSENSKNRW